MREIAKSDITNPFISPNHTLKEGHLVNLDLLSSQLDRFRLI